MCSTEAGSVPGNTTESRSVLGMHQISTGKTGGIMLSKFSIKKPFTMLVAVVIVIVFRVIALTKMTPDLFRKSTRRM